ncbi:peptidase, u32 family large subunit [hydrocarbon metagenome]|uniref:Peptidase, u32 family large subunit n=1 Tax=hydrocarbon metagenome TaxID=938273 RepID=A0A0W8E2P9_9ZZZZ
MKRPELVLPAGDLEKLKTACLFGADAVYVGGKEYSLRAYAGNLSMPEIIEGLKFAHARQRKVYIAVNILARNHDLLKLPEYLEQLAEIGVDGLIISDPGVMKMASRYASHLPITISTQANVSNYEAAQLYGELGAKRIVLARELTLEEIAEIKSRVEVEIEVFVHGAMCVSYSGRCLLSHYMAGRSGNRGECAHPCRYSYSLMEEKRAGEYFPIHEDEKGTYILNSRDLCLLEYIPQLMQAGIDAFKVEGRMKSPLYVASTASTYRSAIDHYGANGGVFTPEQIKAWVDELSTTATRPFTNGFIEGESPLLQDINKNIPLIRVDFCGIVKDYDKQKKMLEIEQRANFGPGEDMEIMLPGQGIKKIEICCIYDKEGQELDRARHPRQRVMVPSLEPIPENSILRRAGA